MWDRQQNQPGDPADELETDPPPVPAWDIRTGAEKTREQIGKETSGDHRYRGIVPTDHDVILYCDHDQAKEFGYDYDGWDSTRELFYYTGEGSDGDQQLKRGNYEIATHKEAGKALRLFIAVGNVPSSDTRTHRYVGEFEIADDPSYLTKLAPDRNDKPRTVLVFRLRPIGDIVTDIGPLSVINGVAAASIVETVSVEAVPQAVVNTEVSDYERAASVSARQEEAALTARFTEYLENTHGHTVQRYKITTPAGILYTDTADITAGVVFEAKSGTDRMSVRLALGQVLDYGRYVEGSDLAVLLPGMPAADLIELLESHQVGCVVEAEGNQFLDVTGLGRCP
jgi:5-methylcytosine-specific restriction protein A